MGRKGPKFEVERLEKEKKQERKEEKKGAEGTGNKAGTKKKRFTQEEEEEEPKGWLEKWAEDPNNQGYIKFFVFAQALLIFLTIGLPQLQKYFDDMMGGGQNKTTN